jgi:hypothetical protein
VIKILENAGPDRRQFIERLLGMSGFASPTVRSVAISLAAGGITAVLAAPSTAHITTTSATTTAGPTTTPRVTPPLHPVLTTRPASTTAAPALLPRSGQSGNLLNRPGNGALLVRKGDIEKGKKY